MVAMRHTSVAIHDIEAGSSMPAFRVEVIIERCRGLHFFHILFRYDYFVGRPALAANALITAVDMLAVFLGLDHASLLAAQGTGLGADSALPPVGALSAAQRVRRLEPGRIAGHSTRQCPS